MKQQPFAGWGGGLENRHYLGGQRRQRSHHDGQLRLLHLLHIHLRELHRLLACRLYNFLHLVPRAQQQPDLYIFDTAAVRKHRLPGVLVSATNERTKERESKFSMRGTTVVNVRVGHFSRYSSIFRNKIYIEKYNNPCRMFRFVAVSL